MRDETNNNERYHTLLRLLLGTFAGSSEKLCLRGAVRNLICCLSDVILGDAIITSHVDIKVVTHDIDNSPCVPRPKSWPTILGCRIYGLKIGLDISDLDYA